MEKESILVNFANRFHMLRHFAVIDPALREEMIRRGITAEAIDKELSEPGSRFYPNFASDIESLLDRVKADGYKEEKGINGNQVWHAKADKALFPGGAGTLSVVHIDEIPTESRGDIHKRENRGIALLHCPIEELPSTSDYTIILKSTQQRYVFITAFPGPPAMPLPDRSMDKSLYEQCRAYWDTHVFLVKR